MFGVLKNLFTRRAGDASDAFMLRSLHAGYSIGFGFMPQAWLNGHRFRIADTHSYIFGDDSFLAYQLTRDDSPGVQMILELDADEPYVALSLPLDIAAQRELFGRTIEHDKSLLSQERITLKEHVSPGLKGWCAVQYDRVMDGVEGVYLDRDYQFVRPDERAEKGRRLKYYLYVDETNEHALEIETYENGPWRVYATVFRPITDLGQVRKPAAGKALANGANGTSHARISSKNMLLAPQRIEHTPPVAEVVHVSPFEEALAEAEAATEENDRVINLEPLVLTRLADEQAVREEQEPEEEEIVAAKIEAVSLDAAEPENHAGNGKMPAQPEAMQPNTEGDKPVLLACPATVAAKLVEEAERNEVSLAQLLRRVLDLPVKNRDTIYLPVDFSPEDYDALARRLPEEGRDAKHMQAFLVKELCHFVGETPPEVALLETEDEK